MERGKTFWVHGRQCATDIDPCLAISSLRSLLYSTPVKHCVFCCVCVHVGVCVCRQKGRMTSCPEICGSEYTEQAQAGVNCQQYGVRSYLHQVDTHVHIHACTFMHTRSFMHSRTCSCMHIHARTQCLHAYRHKDHLHKQMWTEDRWRVTHHMDFSQ